MRTARSPKLFSRTGPRTKHSLANFPLFIRFTMALKLCVLEVLSWPRRAGPLGICIGPELARGYTPCLSLIQNERGNFFSFFKRAASPSHPLSFVTRSTCTYRARPLNESARFPSFR